MELLLSDDPIDRRVRRAVAAVAAGRPVVVVDDADRENEGDLIFAAALATPELLAFTVRHTSGYVCVALSGADCDRLNLPPMHHSSGDRFGTAYRVSVDLRGTGTGISAASRARTIAALAAPESVAGDFLRPGHVVPLRARDGGVLTRPGHTEAAVDLARLAGQPAVGGLCEIVSREKPGEMAHGPELLRFATDHELEHLTIAELIEYRRRTEPQVARVVTTSLPTEQGAFRAIGYRGVHDAAEHVALVAGVVDDGPDVPVHVHVECLTGDVLRSSACNCRAALDEALKAIATGGRGVIVYLRPAGPARVCPALTGDAAEDRRFTANGILADLGVRTAGDTPHVAPCSTRHTAVPEDRRKAG
jgi:3,4-dihydroxy 2-butanone 4-phosphate synthase/GTP cyclohydrolase II